MGGSEGLADQAAGLRRMAQPSPVQVIAVTSGKGGVGKTNVSVNLAVAMAQSGRRVMLLDADLGLANIDVLLGLQPRYNLSHVLSGEQSIEEIIFRGPANVQIIPASSGIQSMAGLSPAEHAGLVRAFGELGLDLDILIVDTAAGISDSVISFSRAWNEIVVVVCDEPASITDAYALIKLLNREHELDHFHVLANMTHRQHEGKELFAKITRVTDRFLDITLEYLGAIPNDSRVRKAIQNQRTVVDMFPSAKSSKAFLEMARDINAWPRQQRAAGHLQFFFERLLHAGEEEWQVTS